MIIIIAPITKLDRAMFKYYFFVSILFIDFLYKLFVVLFQLIALFGVS